MLLVHQDRHLLVQVEGHAAHQEKLLVGEGAVLPAAKQAQGPQRTAVGDDPALQGVIDVIGLVALLVDGRAQPLLLAHQVALPEDGGLPAQAQPAGVVVVGEAHVVLLCLGKFRGVTEGVDQMDPPVLLLVAHDAGIPERDEQLQHGQEIPAQIGIGPAAIELADHIVEDKKVVFLYHIRSHPFVLCSSFVQYTGKQQEIIYLKSSTSSFYLVETSSF